MYLDNVTLSLLMYAATHIMVIIVLCLKDE